MSIVLVLFGVASVWASGIPFNGKKVTVPHQVIALDNAQIIELCDFGQLTLTDTQHAKLLKKCPNFPKTIFTILPCDYGDCGCGIRRPYAILLPSGESVAIENFKDLKNPPTSKAVAGYSQDSMLGFLCKYRESLSERGVYLPPLKWECTTYKNWKPLTGAIYGTGRHGFDTLAEAVLAIPADVILKQIYLEFETIPDKNIEPQIRGWISEKYTADFLAATDKGGVSVRINWLGNTIENPKIEAVEKHLDEALRTIPAMQDTWRALTVKGYKVEEIYSNNLSIEKKRNGSIFFKARVYISLQKKAQKK